MLADIVGRSAYTKTPGAFIPYFQYKIGAYQPDQYLYFPKEPLVIQYRNEIFNKLNEYTGADIPTFLEFHYSSFADKHAFLQFLQYEISDRLNRKPNEVRRQKLQTTQQWISQKQQELQAMQQTAMKREIEQDVRAIVTTQQTGRPAETGGLVDDLTEKLTGLVEKLREGYITGNIRVTEHKHLQSLIQLFYILQTLQLIDGKGKMKGRLFTTFTAIDLASILRLHFADYKDKQQNTIQKEIATVHREIDTSSERFKRLDLALQEFFFGQVQ